MRSRSEMFRFQGRIGERIKYDRQVAVLVEAGYGKTVSALTALLDLQAWPALVVAPNRVARHVWTAESKEWEHLQNLQVLYVGDGLRLPGAKELADAHVHTINYEQLWWLTEHVDLGSYYRAIVFDELSKMKSPGAQRFRRMRGKGPMSIPIRVGLTGNPVGNHMLDLWGEMFMVAGEKPLGPTFSDYRERYFESVDFNNLVYELKHGFDCQRLGTDKPCNCSRAREAAADIRRRIAPHCYVLPAQREVKVPHYRANVIELPVAPKVARMMGELEKQLWTLLDSGAELEALSQSSVAVKLRQLASGAVYLKHDVLEGGVPAADLFPQSEYEVVHEDKMDALVELLDELQGEPALVFYYFRHEERRALERLKGRKVRSGASEGNMALWNAGQLDALLLHPQSAGHGLNLQHGGHVAIWLTQPWGWEQWNQGNKRLARIGQKWPEVTSHVFSYGRVDQRVGAIVRDKEDVERELMDGLAAMQSDAEIQLDNSDLL